ncbi:MAG: hypothetical protein RMI30_07260 [Thermodesulfovibrio sp.]|nr:hypothetical protein [Thermodesulfovibrio sp.]MDW7999221.1 hypothetical protein [Thermodesulfovibrio sp.]
MNEKLKNLKVKVKELEEKGLLSKIENSLFELKELIIKENKERVLCGMTDICAECGKEGKVCCGSAIEFKYSEQLLIINILLGTNFPDEPEFYDMCFFLTSSGCLLFARDTFCINFICDRIRDKIPIDRLKRLTEIEGLHLQLQFKIEQFLKQSIDHILFFHNDNGMNFSCT